MPRHLTAVTLLGITRAGSTRVRMQRVRTRHIAHLTKPKIGHLSTARLSVWPMRL